ncbi:hypothetical protein MNV49_003559 [Pseudohyphozyma bogoriensis]|nr:hypothetical protein MNV49_003559 [Pseudohyphozyma bogoriensis]
MSELGRGSLHSFFSNQQHKYHDAGSRTHSPTPAFSPAPPDVRADLRHVRWGTNDVYGAPEASQLGFVNSLTETEIDVKEEEDDERDDGESGWSGQGRGVTLVTTATRGKMGACYYDGEVGKIYFIEDTEDSDSWDLLGLIIEQTAPHTVLTSSSADASFLDVLQSTLAALPAPSISTDSDDTDRPTQLEFRSSRDFNHIPGKNSLIQLRIVEGGLYEAQERGDVASSGDEADDEDGATTGGLSGASSRGNGGERDAYSFTGRKRKWKGRYTSGVDSDRKRRNKEHRLASFVNGLETSPLTMGCAGCLLSHLSRALSNSGELDSSIEVAGLELMLLDKMMHINQDSLRALQIFDSESHASAYSDKTKEGLSLFGILNLSRTPLGRTLMRHWFLRPPLELDVITSRHHAVECFLRSENQHPAEGMQGHMKMIKNAPMHLRAVAMGKGEMKDWHAILQFFYGINMIRDSALLLTHRRDVEVIDNFLASFDPAALKELGTTINDVIDWDESTLQKRVCVRSGVNPELDELRRQYDGLPSLLASRFPLSRIAADISQEVPATFADTLSLVYFPQLGYLIAVPYANDGNPPPEPEGWDFQSFAADKEIEILEVVSVDLLKYEPQILAVASCLAELDCLLAFAEAARIYEWNRPQMTEESVCVIKQGRHPLVELCVTSFVKNDTSLIGGQGIDWNVDLDSEDLKPMPEDGPQNLSMLIVTGANYSGKSIYLKQVALITFMAHLGSFVPAEAALIGVTDRILTRISTRETISRGVSAFMIDLQQISFALRNATSRSLIVMDEFGKGTQANDGAGLFCGVVQHLVHRGSETPRTVVATHFTHVLANNLLSSALPIAKAHMEILLPEPSTKNSSTTEDLSSVTATDNQITYLYRLAPGLATKSHAAACASLFGINDEVIARANYVSERLSRFEIDALVLEELDEEEKAELADVERVTERFLEWDLSEEVCGEMELDEVLQRLRAVVGGDEDEAVL